MKFYIKLFIIFIWMSIIFYFSHQNGNESSEASQIVVDILNVFGININSYLGNITHLLIRKVAHLIEYFILAILIYFFLKDFLIKKYCVYYSIGFSFLYACSDEFHQMFIPLRGPSIIDVLIDVSGAILGMLIIYLLKKVKKNSIDHIKQKNMS